MADLLSIEELRGKFENATKTDEPVAIQTPTNSQINGNPTLMGMREPSDYKLTFWLPVVDGNVPQGATLVMNGTAYVQEVTAKQKFISARIARKVRNYASTIAIAFTDFKEDGSSDIYTAEDLMKVYEIFDDNVISACEKLVINVLGVSENLMEYITDLSLIETCGAILENNPSFFQDDFLSGQV